MNTPLIFEMSQSARDVIKSILIFMAQIKERKSEIESLQVAKYRADLLEFGQNKFDVTSGLCRNLGLRRITEFRSCMSKCILNIDKFVEHDNHTGICAWDYPDDLVDIIFILFCVKHVIGYDPSWPIGEIDFNTNNYTKDHIRWQLFDFMFDSFTEIHKKGTLTW